MGGASVLRKGRARTDVDPRETNAGGTRKETVRNEGGLSAAHSAADTATAATHARKTQAAESRNGDCGDQPCGEVSPTAYAKSAVSETE